MAIIRALALRPPSPATPDTGLSQPRIDVAETDILANVGETPTNDITWEDPDIERGPIAGITASFGEVINISDPSVSPGTAQWRAVNVQAADDRQVFLTIEDADGLIDVQPFNLFVVDPGGAPTVIFATDPESGNEGEWSAYLPLSRGVQLVGSWADADAGPGAEMQDYMRVEIDGVDRSTDGVHQVSNRDGTSGSWTWYSENVDLSDDEKEVIVTLRDFAGQEGSDQVTLKFRVDDILRDLPSHVSPKASVWEWQDPAPVIEWDKGNGGATWAQVARPFEQGIHIPAESVTMRHTCTVDGHYEMQLGLRTHDVDNWMLAQIQVRINGETIADYFSNGIQGERDADDQISDVPLDHDCVAGDLIEIELTGYNVLVPDDPTPDVLPWLEWTNFILTPPEGPPAGELVFHWKAGEV